MHAAHQWLVAALVTIVVAGCPSALAQSRVVGEQVAAPGGATSAPRVATRPPQKAPAVPSPRTDLINEALEQTAPLTREELLAFRKELEERGKGLTERAAGRPAPRPSAQIFQIDLSAAAVSAPPVVRVTPGQGAVVSFLDASGAPWPIQLADNANADGGIVVQKFTNHQLSVFVRNHAAMGNVLVALQGLPTAVSFTVVSGQDLTDYQVQLVVPRFKDGPPAHVISSGSVPALGTADLFDYLLRTPPTNAKPLKVEGLPGTVAWQTGPSKMVVRTQALIAEAMRHFALDGTGVYEVRLSPLVLGTVNGRFVELRISGF
jgi:intracellular multiplication protein IcmK